MLDWLLGREPDRFDPAWEATLERGVWQYRFLTPEHRERVHAVVANLVARKRWTGGGGFEVTDTMRVVVSGVAALMTIGLDEPFFFPKLKTFILYPAGYDASAILGSTILGDASDPLLGGGPRLGEAWQHGPVVLSWRAAERQARVRGRGRNLVLHEMAHHVDSYDGAMDGTPYYADADEARRWWRIAEEEYHRLVGQARRREVTLLDHYGASSRAEFFAVATECFFERPHAMRERHAELYRLLVSFYHQDPTAWAPTLDKPPVSAPAAATTHPKRPAGRTRRGRFPDLSHLCMSGVDELFAHGVLLLRREEYDVAQRVFGEVLDRDPDDAEARQHRAEARLALGDYHGAVEDASAAHAADPTDGAPLLTHAQACLQLGDDATARRLLERLPSSDRDGSEAQFLLGELCLRAGDARGAARAFRRVVGHDPLDALAHLWLAAAVEELGDAAAAKAHRERALQLDPGLAEGRPLA